MTASVFLTGLGTGLSLILAIGAQNAFVLRQGLKREHVFVVCLICALSDAALVTLGVAGFGTVARVMPWLDPAFRYGGAAFLMLYAFRSLQAALKPHAGLKAAPAAPASLRATMLTALALTFLNPHVYLDTVILLGSISTRFPASKPAFAAGAMTASALFFFSLGYGARLLGPLFARPSAWRVLDFIIALIMGSIAVKLLIGD
ncbi:amino acid transporter [Xaviernesmea oryzae]|uniref:Amino acid transporter n=1 Tax=Xaviernesmea oryzae TaxID=464029 RepID=A0A1Q9B130_9HYPH|nr:LysE/ArgO family amino acid transporter [Xaviernesmea oryzae]OLP61670.1 amino acid transporter [Xaviernesmea oryzae]SEL03487.1 L-lysine exporter family protein LysE/ArgO [Xaviernesmea oryzae]